MHLIDIFVAGADDDGNDGPSSRISFACSDGTGFPHGMVYFTKVFNIDAIAF